MFLVVRAVHNLSPDAIRYSENVEESDILAEAECGLWSTLFSNFMAGNSVKCNEYMTVWFVLGHGVKCCNLSATVMNFNTRFWRWHKLKYDDRDEDCSLQGHETV